MTNNDLSPTPEDTNIVDMMHRTLRVGFRVFWRDPRDGRYSTQRYWINGINSGDDIVHPVVVLAPIQKEGAGVPVTCNGRMLDNYVLDYEHAMSILGDDPEG